MKILITGSTGFIGCHLINELLKNKNIEIIATSRNKEKAKEISWFKQVTYIPYDLNLFNNTNLFEFFQKPDRVIHLAWDGLPNYDDLIHLERNLYTQFNFIKNMIENGLKDITITGTCLEYGKVDGSLNENIITNPSNSYGIAKDSLRKFIEVLNKKHEFNYKWIRLFYMYGEGQSEKSILSLLDKAIRNNEKEFNMSKGEQLRDYLHIKDVVKNILLISNQTLYSNQIINCCNGEPISIRKFVENYLDKKEYNMKLNLGFYSYPDYEPMAFWGNNTKLNLIKKGKK